MQLQNFVLIACFAFGAASGMAEPAETFLKQAESAMGAAGLNTLVFSAMGSRSAEVGQPLSAELPWPLVKLTSYRRSVNYKQQSATEEIGFVEPVYGGQHQSRSVHGTRAWNLDPTVQNPSLPRPPSVSCRSG
jgi:hypothetical protein